jgi:hypothetical protein
MEERLLWISPLEPQVRHDDIQSKRIENYVGWFLESENFQQWCDGEKDGERSTIMGYLLLWAVTEDGKTFIW